VLLADELRQAPGSHALGQGPAGCGFAIGLMLENVHVSNQD
jgi:hypothetical protein